MRPCGLTVLIVSLTQGIHRVGPGNGTLILRTARQGLAANVGHDLTIVVDRWSGEIRVGDDPADSSVEITAELPSLRVLEGSGGMKPLTDRDRGDIARNAHRQLDADRFPQARYVSTGASGTAEGGVLEGALALHGRERPLRLTVTALGEDRYRATGAVLQSDFGIKPYSAMLGALKLADAVQLEAELDLSGTEP